MAENSKAVQKDIPVQNAGPSKNFNRNALLARRIKAIQDAGNMTPKSQRGLDRLAAKLNGKRK